jgi:hypothetical protein
MFIKFWRFNAFFDEAFTVTSRSKTIVALRLCVLDGNASADRRCVVEWTYFDLFFEKMFS